MATRLEHKQMALNRLKTVEVLMAGSEWDMAGYIMGYVLECALKAAICKNLKQIDYPDAIRGDDKAKNFFKSHSFDRLLLLSGMTDIFKLQGNTVSRNWGDFTFKYPVTWTEMRYQTGWWTEADVKNCYAYLTDKPDGILNQFVKKRRW